MPLLRGTGVYARLLGRYFLVGLIAALAELATFYSLVRLGAGIPVSAIFGFCVGTAVNYPLSRRFAFRSKGGNRRREIVLTYFVSLVALAANLAVTEVIISVFVLGQSRLGVMLAKVAGTGLGFILNFLGRQFIVFPHGAAQPMARGAGFEGRTGVMGLPRARSSAPDEPAHLI